MRDLEPYWLTASYQPRDSAVAEFRLRPLDMASDWELTSSMIGRPAPSWDAVAQVLRASVVGWRGVHSSSGDEVPFSAAALAAALAPDADHGWMIWWMECCGDLLRRARLADVEKKVS